MSVPQGPNIPLADVLAGFEQGKFVLSNLAAKRAKQLRDGAPPLIRTESNHPLTIALAEIAAGKIRGILGPEVQVAIEEASVPAFLDETVPAELGMLLPSLDEVEVDLIGADLKDELHDPETDGLSDEAPVLSDLLDDDEETVVAGEGDEDTLSLNDLAESEAADEEEEHN